MSNGVDFRVLALDLRRQLNEALARETALQQRLTVQDQRVDELVELLTASQNAMPWVSNSELWERIHAALKPTAEAESYEPKCKEGGEHGPWSDNYTYCITCGYYDKSRADD
jgi:hypothetical protein